MEGLGEVKLPEGKVLIPGVISHATNVVEHPELVAERIVRYASLVGRENVHRRHRLRLRAGTVPPPRPPLDHVGEARGAWRKAPALRARSCGREAFPQGRRRLSEPGGHLKLAPDRAVERAGDRRRG